VFSDGTTHYQFTSQEFLERIAALIPIPFVNLVRYNGVFAPASPLRSRVIGKRKKGEENQKSSISSRIQWSELLKRTFEIDLLSCPCGGKLQLKDLVRYPEQGSDRYKHLGPKAGPPDLSYI